MFHSPKPKPSVHVQVGTHKNLVLLVAKIYSIISHLTNFVSFNRVLITVIGIGSFFAARKYVEGNRQEAMKVRQKANITFKEEIIRLKSELEERKRSQ